MGICTIVPEKVGARYLTAYRVELLHHALIVVFPNFLLFLEAHFWPQSKL